MRKLLLVLAGVSVLGISPALLRAAPRQDPQILLIKTRQKQERRALKLKERSEKVSFKGQQVPKGLRDQRKHQMQKERRDLRDKQKAELQDAKDKERIFKEGLRR